MSKSYSEDFIGKIFPLVAPITSNGFMNYKALRVLKDYPFDRDEVNKLVGKTVSPISTNDIFGTKKYCIIDPDRKYGALYDVGTTENGKYIIAWNNFQDGTVIAWIDPYTYTITDMKFFDDDDIDMFYGIKFDYDPNDKRPGHDIREIFSQCSYGVRNFIRCGGGYYAFVRDDVVFEIRPVISLAMSCEASRNNNDGKYVIGINQSSHSDIIYHNHKSQMDMIQYSTSGINYRLVENVRNFDVEYVDDTNLFMKRSWPTMFQYNTPEDFLAVYNNVATAEFVEGKVSTMSGVRNDYDPTWWVDGYTIMNMRTCHGIYHDIYILDPNHNVYKVVNHKDLISANKWPSISKVKNSDNMLYW